MSGALEVVSANLDTLITLDIAEAECESSGTECGDNQYVKPLRYGLVDGIKETDSETRETYSVFQY